jgi:hypothetical protein
MNCVTHPAVEAAAYCRICGRAMCTECKRDIRGVIYCEPCLERELHATTPPPTIPYTVGAAAAQAGPIPGLALGLGFIPGVGAIYNGQYAKAFVHVVIFGLLISILDSGEAGHFEVVFALLLPAFIFYMASEAYHTAKKRLLGQPVEEWSGVFSNDGPQQTAAGGNVIGPRAGGAMFLIGLGICILLGNLGYLSLHQVMKFWPLVLIGLGVAMLVGRMNNGSQGGE